MFESRDKAQFTLSAHDERRRPADADAARAGPEGEDISARITEKLIAEPVAPFRWVPWVLAFLVTGCLLLAAWVWFELLHM